MTWWRRRTLRARLLVIGVTGLCLGLTLGGVVFVAALGRVLQRSVDSDAQRTALDVAVMVDAGALPQPVPVAGAELVQVVDAQGRVRSASSGADRLVPMLRPDELRRARSGQRLMIDGEPLGLTGPVRVLAVPAGPPGDPQTVIVARSMLDLIRGLGLMRTTLFVVFPLLVVVLAVVAWRVVGASLRPVEALRRSAEEITGTGGSERLPVPVGRDEIHRLAVTLNGMLDRLDTGRARQREFVADAAHELRTPLATMRVQLEVAQRLGPTADWPAVADDLLLDTRRLSRLVDDLLLLARTDDPAAVARAEPVDLVDLVTDVVLSYPVASPSPPAVAVTTPEGPLWTLGDPVALRRVLANLLDNAERYARTRIDLDLATEGEHHLVTVTDDGPGIAEDDRQRVFDRFTRLDDSRTRDDSRAGGAGLGLAIVADIIGRHGGSVRLSTPPAAIPGEAADLLVRAPGDQFARGGPGLRVEVRLRRHTPPD
jgi:signal transduction histidine kinase